MIFIMLINVKMPTIIIILILMSMINTTFESIKQEKSLFLSVLDFMSIQNPCSVELSSKKCFNLGPGNGQQP